MPATVFYAFRDSPVRRRALGSSRGSAERYALFGLDELAARDFVVRHNLERKGGPQRWAVTAGAVLKAALERAGGYGGDFATVLGSLRPANSADVVFSTVDTVGIPLMLLRRAGRLRPPLVYVAIGLPERLVQLRSERMRRLYASALGSCASVIAYSQHEADELRSWLAGYGFTPPVVFVAFGVDTEAFRPGSRTTTVDIVTVGTDPHRDFALLLHVAQRLPDVSFRIVTSREHLRRFSSVPENVSVETEIPFEEMRRRLMEARVVALPVRENSYSGATTVLLQAMALGKPVVVTRTKAIETGYGLVDGENCRLVAPGDDAGFERALTGVLRDEFHARALGSSARTTVERELTWDRYVSRIEELLRDAVATPATSRPGAA
jgi:glycosyltransferase involved in cell wall biosynthesis